MIPILDIEKHFKFFVYSSRQYCQNCVFQKLYQKLKPCLSKMPSPNKVNIFYTLKPIHLILSGADWNHLVSDPKVIPLSSFHCIRETENAKTNTEIVSDSKS